MKKLVLIEAFGLEVTPWSAAEISIKRTKAGKTVRTAFRRKKSDLAHGKTSLADWQGFVAQAAEEAFAGQTPHEGPALLMFEFIAKTPEGHQHGDVWTVPIEFNAEKGEWVKLGPRGKQEPDVVNMMKGTEDALQGLVFRNDVQSRIVMAYTFFGPIPGVRVAAFGIEPSDRFAGISLLW